MATAPKTTTNTIPEISDSAHAPFIFIEEAPSFGNTVGNINVTVAAYRHIPDGKGAIKSDLIVTAHLRCSIAGARVLRDALNSAILLGEPTGDKPN